MIDKLIEMIIATNNRTIIGIVQTITYIMSANIKPAIVMTVVSLSVLMGLGALTGNNGTVALITIVMTYFVLSILLSTAMEWREFYNKQWVELAVKYQAEKEGEASSAHYEQEISSLEKRMNEIEALNEEKQKKLEAENKKLKAENARLKKAKDTKQANTKEWARDVLGIEESASPAEIKAKHRKLIKVLHPDAGGSSTLSKDVNAALELLK